MESTKIIVSGQLAPLSSSDDDDDDDDVTVINSSVLCQPDDSVRGHLSQMQELGSLDVTSKHQSDHRPNEIAGTDLKVNSGNHTGATEYRRSLLISNSPTPNYGKPDNESTGTESRNEDTESEANERDTCVLEEPVHAILIESMRHLNLRQSAFETSQLENELESETFDGKIKPTTELDPPTGRGPVGGVAVAFQVHNAYGMSTHFGTSGKRPHGYFSSPEEVVHSMKTSIVHEDSVYQPSKFSRPVPVESDDGSADTPLPELNDILTPDDLEELLGPHLYENFDLLPFLKVLADEENQTDLIDAPNSTPMLIIPSHEHLPTYISSPKSMIATSSMASNPVSFPNMFPCPQTSRNCIAEGVSTPYGPVALISGEPSTALHSSLYMSAGGNGFNESVHSQHIPIQRSSLIAGSSQLHGNSEIYGHSEYKYGRKHTEIDTEKGLTPLAQSVAFASNPVYSSPFPMINTDICTQNRSVFDPPRAPTNPSQIPISTTATTISTFNPVSPKMPCQLPYTAGPQRTEQLMNERRQLAKASSVVARLTRDQLVISDTDQDTLLHLAIAKNERYLTESLICRLDREKLTDSMINLRNKQGQSPLCLAIVTNQSSVVKLLVERNADVNVRIPLGTKNLRSFCSPVHFAASNGKEWLQTLCELLKDESIKLSALDCDGFTALHKAVSSHGLNLFHGRNCEKIDSKESIKQLIIGGMDINQLDGVNSKTALHMALEKGDLDLFSYIIDLVSRMIDGINQRIRSTHHPVNARTGRRGDTLLHIVATSFRTTNPLDTVILIQYLLSCGANPQLRNNENRLPWEVATMPQVAEILKI